MWCVLCWQMLMLWFQERNSINVNALLCSSAWKSEKWFFFVFVNAFQEPIRLGIFSWKSKTYSKGLLIFSAISIEIVLLKTHHLSINISPPSAFIKVPFLALYSIPFFISWQKLPASCDFHFLFYKLKSYVNPMVLLCSFDQDSLCWDFLSFYGIDFEFLWHTSILWAVVAQMHFSQVLLYSCAVHITSLFLSPIWYLSSHTYFPPPVYFGKSRMVL